MKPMALVLSAFAITSMLVCLDVAHAANKKKPWMCNDYLSKRNPDGERYRSQYLTEKGYVWVNHHLGIDYCGPAGTAVISSTHGTVTWAGYDFCGGGVVVATDIWITDESKVVSAIYAYYWHIDPLLHLRGSPVRPGDVIGTIQDPRKIKGRNKCMGKAPHVHLGMRKTQFPSLNHVDPNEFRIDGKGKLTCFSDDKQVPSRKAVAPVRC